MSLSGTRLASPDEVGTSCDVWMVERAKVPAIETVGIIRKQEHLVGPKREAAVPGRQWPSETVGESSLCHEMAIDEYTDVEAADLITHACEDGLEQVRCSRKVASVGRQRSGVRREASQGNVPYSG